MFRTVASVVWIGLASLIFVGVLRRRIAPRGVVARATWCAISASLLTPVAAGGHGLYIAPALIGIPTALKRGGRDTALFFGCAWLFLSAVLYVEDSWLHRRALERQS